MGQISKLSSLKQRVVDRIVRDLVTHLRPHWEFSMLRQHHVYGDAALVEIAETANVNNGLFNVASGTIKVEDYVFFGHNVCVLTGTHDYTKFDLERQTTIPKSGRDVIIKRGAWIASNVTILGPCLIGEHAVVAAGSVVSSDVAPHSIVGGIPARKIGEINQNPSPADPPQTEEPVKTRAEK
jgi:acetyltransferase-like isoleucine patch superfamily enzyme